ncbi:PEP/pyruvate-binding domain-containing protein [Nonomuraea candida]|uniref:PEP/pyruvate-binding domain-containing protein n=1 Tax=Nonomuraea candida TaxID=359159 RepID=UPI0005B7E087|nr:PEP/pyruvate-binding domain-containing protein [Nonomuraea candida]
MLVPLMQAAAGTCGGKAGALGALLRAGLPIPDGFVVPYAAYLAAVRDLDLGRTGGGPAAARRAIEGRPLHATLVDELERALAALGDPPVAVRSSAANEDTAQESAAGRHESFLAVHGAGAVADAVRACWASLFSERAIGLQERPHDGATTAGLGDGSYSGPAMAVLVQRLVDAEVSGVMFTPANPYEPTTIEASWGLGPSVVGGTVTPDAYRVAGDGSVTSTIADKPTRLDRHGTRLAVREVPAGDRNRPTLDGAAVTGLAGLGEEIAARLGGAQDIEWAIADGRTWILQARPVTAALPPAASPATTPDALAAAPGVLAATPGVLAGTPGSHGTVTGVTRIVRGPGDFARVRPGDILVCRFTDPAWTPLLRIAGGVVTEVGGALSHAAIVAREQAIPAVLGVPDATGRLHDGALITIDGTAGTVTAATA